MNSILPSLLAFTAAALVTYLELLTTSYPRTGNFIRTCKGLYAFVTVYGVIAFGVAYFFNSLVSQGALKLEGLGMSNEWIRAVALGISVKALLHIRLFTVGVGAKNMPFGTETIVQIFEPWLLEQIALHEFNSIREFLEPWNNSSNDVGTVRNKILDNLPYTFSGTERVAFEVALKKRDKSPIECMEMYLRRFGRRSFERAFGSPST